MKKLTASIFTVLLATIGTANADIASQAYVDKQTGTLTNLTTTAKDNLVGAINELNTKAGNKSVATQIAEALVPYSTTEQSDAAYATAAQGAKADTAVQPAAISDMQIKSNLVTSMSESSTDTQYPSAKAVYTAVEAAKTAATYDDTALSAKVTANETAISTINSSAPMTSGITQAKVGQYDTLVTNAASYGDIVTHDADEFATAAQGLKADSAVQPAAISDMQVKSNLVTSMSESSTDTQYPSAKAVYTAVEAAKTAATYDDTALSAKVTANETAISTINSSAPMTSGITQAKVGQYDTLVTNAASYGDIVTHDADEFATAAQGTKADSAVQSVTKSGEGNILTGITTTDHAVTVTVSGTAIPQPSGSCKDCVLHYNGKAYSWEEITR